MCNLHFRMLACAGGTLEAKSGRGTMAWMQSTDGRTEPLGAHLNVCLCLIDISSLIYACCCVRVETCRLLKLWTSPDRVFQVDQRQPAAPLCLAGLLGDPQISCTLA